MMHDYHPGLPKYDPDAILQDGCEECEHRASQGVAGLLNLDQSNISLLWERMLNSEYGGQKVPSDAGHYRSDCERALGHQLYLIAILIERYSDSTSDMIVWSRSFISTKGGQ